MKNSQKGFAFLILIVVIAVVAVGGGAYYYSTTVSENNQPRNTPATVLQCADINIEMPEKWANLQPTKNNKLDDNGCSIDNSGCLCAKKDPTDPTQNVMFSILVATPPPTFTLKNSLPKNTSETKEINFLGLSAIQFTTPGPRIIGGINFFKDNKIYSLTLTAKDTTFNDLWPDMLTALHNSEL